MLYTTTGNLFFLFWRTLSLFASSSSFISCVSVCLVMNFLPLICSDVHLSPWLDEIELPNRRICDVHFRLTLALSFSFSLQPAGRRSMQAEMREEEGKVFFFFFFFLSFLLSHPGLVFFFLFSPHLHLCRHAQKNLGLFLLALLFTGMMKESGSEVDGFMVHLSRGL